MRDVDVVGVVGEEPVAALDQVGDRGPFGGQGLAALGDVGPEVGHELSWSWRTSRSTQADAGRLVARGTCSNAVIAEQVP